MRYMRLDEYALRAFIMLVGPESEKHSRALGKIVVRIYCLVRTIPETRGRSIFKRMMLDHHGNNYRTDNQTCLRSTSLSYYSALCIGPFPLLCQSTILR